MRHSAGVALLTVLFGTACGSDADLSGDWSGTLTDGSNASGSSPLSWRVSQTGSVFSGNATAGPLLGTVAGSVSSEETRYTMSFPVAACTITLVGAGSVRGSEMQGTYTAANDCLVGTAVEGRLTLGRTFSQ
jgi:hypothetical protein